MKRAVAKDIDEYIEGFPSDVQKILQKIRKTIRKAAPAAEEAISYAIPTFKLNGYLIYFAGFQRHVSVYPAPRGVKEFEADMARYQAGKGTVRFALDEPVPYELITRIVKYRAGENLVRASAKSKAGKKSKKRTASKKAPARRTSKKRI
ncbi:MAG TPA: DUF1801 domain-containing protein [Pyrinomonadaceae bacterium]|nr:DUF1801 domain-containing protein [Pyrinomonadaceae bacterium]